jgi:hypothetical protein
MKIFCDQMPNLVLRWPDLTACPFADYSVAKVLNILLMPGWELL